MCRPHSLGAGSLFAHPSSKAELPLGLVIFLPTSSGVPPPVGITAELELPTAKLFSFFGYVVGVAMISSMSDNKSSTNCTWLCWEGCIFNLFMDGCGSKRELLPSNKVGPTGFIQGFCYFRGRKITENHGNRPTLKITEITENHGKSRKRKLKFLLISIVVPGCHGKSRKITETEMKVPVVCYCCSWLLGVRVCISLCVFSRDMSSSDENGTPAAKKRKVWQRGSKMSARVRAQQFPGQRTY